jgi:hypothetical protein
VDAAFDDRDVDSILSGIFHINSHFADIAVDIHAIRLLLEDGDGEEEEEDDGGEDPDP